MKQCPIELNLWDENVKDKSNVWKYESLDKTRKPEQGLSDFFTLQHADDLLVFISHNW